MKNLNMNVLTGRLLSVFGAALCLSVLLTSPANADVQASSDSLKACLDRQIKTELKKESPNKQTVLNNCAKELKALELQLPAGAKEAVKHDLDHGISEQLKPKKS